jgi:hypothetical protein
MITQETTSLTEQEKQDKFLMELIPIKNIQISYLGCHIVVFEKTPAEIINILKKLNFEHYKNGVYHTLKKENMYFQVTNRRNEYFSLRVNPDLIKLMNLEHFYLK